MITFDIETVDPLLEEKGPGVYRKDGYVLGCAIKRDNEPSRYYSFAHMDTSEEDRRKNKVAVAEILATTEDKLAANCQYDIDWLENFEGIKVNGTVHDIQIAEPLLDEYAKSYSVNTLAQKYLGKTKLYDGIEAYHQKMGWKGKAIENIDKMPEALVGEYACGDTDEEYEIWKRQMPLIQAENLQQVYDMEIGLTPILIRMRKEGIRIDVNKRAESGAILRAKYNQLRQQLFAAYGPFNHNSTADLVEILDKEGISYGRTERGAPSVKKEDLERSDHQVAKDILALRQIDKNYSAFVMGAYVDFEIDGRIHCQFYPLRKDDGGTVSGRFSSQNPNLQQVPKRDEEEVGAFDFEKLIRAIFIPEEDHLYGKIDYSQIEYRVIAHYARGQRSAEVKERYNSDPKTDYHKMVQGWAHDFGYDLSRGDTKRINFGIAYYMGAPALARKFNWTREKADSMIAMYKRTMPFIWPTRQAVVDVAKGRGYITTILGRRSRVNEYMRKEGKEYSMFNRLIQGSAADINKKGMLDAWNAGVFAPGLLIPHLTVHDELGISVPKNKAGLEAYRELKHCMENCVKLRVPILAEAEIGPNWGECDAVDWTMYE